MTNKPVILCIDDEEDIRTMITDTLAEYGYLVIGISSGEDALVYLENEGGADLILLDLMMPGLSGLEVLQLLKVNPQTCDIPVIMITADGQLSEKRDAFSLGAGDYLVKPFEPEELVMRMESQLRIRDAVLAEKNAAYQMKTLRDQFQEFFESFPDAILIIENGIVTSCNEAATSLFQMRREDLIGLPPEQFSPDIQPDGRDSHTAAGFYIRKCVAEGRTRFEWVHLRGDETEIFTEVSLAVLPGDEDRLLATFRDISERRTAETALRESEEKFQSLVSNLPGLTYRCRNDADWTMLYMSDIIDQLSLELVKLI